MKIQSQFIRPGDIINLGGNVDFRVIVVPAQIADFVPDRVSLFLQDTTERPGSVFEDWTKVRRGKLVRVLNSDQDELTMRMLAS